MNSGRVHSTPGIHLSKSNQFPHGKTQAQELTEMLQISNSAGEVVTIKLNTWLMLSSTSGIKNRLENV